jgi:5'-nucleotidase
MHLLLSNDDGYQGQGLIELAAALRELATITIVAPNRNRSAASNSLTLERPLRPQVYAERSYAVDGTPTDCVHLGLTGLLDDAPDMVVSGINAGANLGDDVIYSGTVAAAMEGRFLGLPAVAISQTSFNPKHVKAAASLSARLISSLLQNPIQENMILNVNIPDLPLAEIKGFKTTRLGNRHKAEPAVKAQDPRGKPIYWVGAAGPEQDAGPGTDFHAINEGYVSISPIHVDLTRHRSLDTLQSWIEESGLST